MSAPFTPPKGEPIGGLQVLFRSERILVIDKPPGRLVIPGRNPDSEPSLREQLETELRQKVWVVHRLDRDTSGALLFALDADSHRALNNAFERRLVEKTYLALVRGQLNSHTELSWSLVPARRGRMRVAHAGEQGKEAKTLVRPLSTGADMTLVEAVPLTGRTHQIRVHLAHAGHPLLVDPQYGSHEPYRAPNGDIVLTRTPLHATRLQFPKLEGLLEAGLVVESKMPADVVAAASVGQLTSPETAGTQDIRGR